MLAQRRRLPPDTGTAIDPNAKVLTDDFAPVEALEGDREPQPQMARSAIERPATQQPLADAIAIAAILANAFFVGAVLMGFEMLGSRYLFPYFGGGIGTWAGLISTVLGALTIGYFAGGACGRSPSEPRASSPPRSRSRHVYLALVPATADPRDDLDPRIISATGRRRS